MSAIEAADGKRITVCLALCALGLAATRGDAAWEIVPDVALGVIANDNPRLRAATPRNTSSMLIDAEVTLRSIGERGSLYMRPRYRSTSYADSEDEDLDTDDYYLRTLGEYQWRAARAGFTANFSQESIRNAELLEVAPEDPDIPEPVETDTGRLLFLQQERRQYYVQPFVELDLSERSAVRLETRLIDSRYSDIPDADTTRTDFTETWVSAGLVRRVDELNSVSAAVIVSRYEAERNDNVTDSVGVEGTFSRVLSSAWTMQLSAGVERSEYSFLTATGPFSNADANFAFDLGLRKRTDLDTLNLDLRRTISPNASGFLVERNELRVYARRLLSERVALLGGARLVNMTSLDNADEREDRNFYRVELGAEWALARQWFLSVGYNYTWQEFSKETTAALAREADANEFRLLLAYRGLARE